MNKVERQSKPHTQDFVLVRKWSPQAVSRLIVGNQAKSQVLQCQHQITEGLLPDSL